MVLLELAEPVAEADPGAEGPVTEKEEPSSQDAGEEGGLEPAPPLPQSKSAAPLPQARIAVPQRLVPALGAPRFPGRTDGLRTGWQIGAGGKLYIPKGDAAVPRTSRKAAFGRTLPTRDAVHAENEVGEDHALLVRLLGTHKKAVESSPVKRLAARRLVSPPKAQSCSPRPGMTVCTEEGTGDLSFTSSMGRLGRAGGPRMAPRPGASRAADAAALWPGATAPPPADSTGVAERAEPSSLEGRSDEADVPTDAPPSAERGAAPLRRVKTVQIELPPSTPPRSTSDPQEAS